MSKKSLQHHKKTHFVKPVTRNGGEFTCIERTLNESSDKLEENTLLMVEKSVDTVQCEVNHEPDTNATASDVICIPIKSNSKDERPFKCTSCPKTFKLESMLRYHESLHKDEKFFECDVCGRTCVNFGNITAHMKSHGNIKPFGCNLCSFTYSNIMKLGAHFRDFHGVGKKSL